MRATRRQPNSVSSLGDARSRFHSLSRARKAFAGWALWGTPKSARLYLLLAHSGVGSLATIAIVHLNPDLTSSARFVLLAVLSLGYAIAVDRVAVLRRYLQLGHRSAVWTNQTSIWTFAGALALPLGYACLLVLAIYGDILIRGWRHRSIRTYRVVFGITTALAGVMAANAVGRAFDAKGGVAAQIELLAQLGAYTVSSLVLAVIGLRLYGGTGSLRASLPRRKSVLMEIATLLLGLITAQLLAHDVMLTPLVVFMGIALHRSSMVQELAAAARVDIKTGLLNAAAWRAQAEEQWITSVQEQRHIALLVIDLDHFKRVNDTYGHIAGDAVLSAVGTCLATLTRDGDCAGRFGGEEFVVLLPGSRSDAALVLAERVRREIHVRTMQLGTPVTASVGIATSTKDAAASSLDELVSLADAALYEAKDAGRDQSRTAVMGMTGDQLSATA